VGWGGPFGLLSSPSPLAGNVFGRGLLDDATYSGKNPLFETSAPRGGRGLLSPEPEAKKPTGRDLTGPDDLLIDSDDDAK